VARCKPMIERARWCLEAVADGRHRRGSRPVLKDDGQCGGMIISLGKLGSHPIRIYILELLVKFPSLPGNARGLAILKRLAGCRLGSKADFSRRAAVGLLRANCGNCSSCPRCRPHDDLVDVHIRRLPDGKGPGALLQGYINDSMLPTG